MLENCSVYIVADHGEMFVEFGHWSHANNINPWVISVPMLIYDNDLSWYKNTETATLKDVAPTLADRLGYPIPSCWQGHSLGKPLQDFSSRINVENKCDFPEGILAAHNGNLTLDILDENKKLKKKAILLKDSVNWRIEEIKE